MHLSKPYFKLLPVRVFVVVPEPFDQRIKNTRFYFAVHRLFQGFYHFRYSLIFSYDCHGIAGQLFIP